MLKIIKNDVISHSDNKRDQVSIYSIDFQKNGNRLATGGGGKLFSLFYILFFLFYSILFSIVYIIFNLLNRFYC